MEPLVHPITSTDPEWNESYYFIMGNQEHNIHLMTRMGFKPNKKEAMLFCFIFLPDGTVACYQTHEKQESYQPPFHVGKMTFKPHPVENTWHYTFSESMMVLKDPKQFPQMFKDPTLIDRKISVQLDVHLQPLNEPYEYSAHMTPESLEIGKKSGDQHWEQLGLINGYIQIDKQKYPLIPEKTMGQRDHTYGIRDWTAIGDWLYYVVWFYNKNLAINPACIVTNDGRTSIGGFLYKDGVNITIKNIRIIKQQFTADGIFPISSELEIIDNNQTKHILHAKAGSALPVPFVDAQGKKAVLIQAVGYFELDGISGGNGSYEVLRKH